MDEHDYAIFRFLSPDGLLRFWGSRRIVDPRISTREIAEKVGLSETATRARLRAMRERGVLRSRETWLNPGLFDVNLVRAEIPVAGAAEAQKLLEEIALVDGVTFARDILDEEDRKLQVYYVADQPSSTARRTALLRRLSPSASLRGPAPYWIPAPERAMTPLDWRMLRAFRRRPEGSVAELAREVGVSAKTAASRYHRLLEDHACWWTPDAASDEMPLALVAIETDPTADPVPIADEIARRDPGWMPVAADGFGLPPTAAHAPIVGLVPAEGPAAVERSIRRFLDVPGVGRIRRTFALGSARFPQWLDEHLASRLPRAR